jgi:hypothetical protein
MLIHTFYKSLEHTLSLLSLLSHILHITRAHAKSSQFAFTIHFLVTDLNDGDSSASVLTSLLSGEYPATELGASAD